MNETPDFQFCRLIYDLVIKQNKKKFYYASFAF